MVVESIPCYVVNLNTDEQVTFNVEIPEEVNESYSATYEDQATRGRSSPFKSFNNSGPHSIDFTVTLLLDYRKDLTSVVECLRDMLKPSKSTVIIPPRVKVRIGNVLDIKAAPLNFSFRWGNGYKDGVYRTCDCSFSFDEVEDVGTFADGSKKDYVAVIPESKNQVNSATDYNYGEKYELTEEKTGYYTAAEALAGKSSGNPTGTCKPGTYYIYNKSKGMINITKQQGTPGSWINPN